MWGEDVGCSDGMREASAGGLRNRTSLRRPWEPAKGLKPGEEMLACVVEGSLSVGWRTGRGQAVQEGQGGAGRGDQAPCCGPESEDAALGGRRPCS